MIMANEDLSSSDKQAPQDSHREMTRKRLYALVWQTPMSRLAKTFGLSDVGLRKICTKHDIPTPPLGYWAKVAHGKRVRQPPLPSRDDRDDVAINLRQRVGPEMPPAIKAAQDAALAREASHAPVVVPAERPVKLHTIAAATARSLREAKADHEGFKHGSSREGVAVVLARPLIDRALRLIDAFVRAAEARGHTFVAQDGGVRLEIDGVPLRWRLYEVKDRTPHVPTKQELAAQARREEDRVRWPSLYSSQRTTKVYPAWDYGPSGRLSMTFEDGSTYRWGRNGLIGHWHDRKRSRLEGVLTDALATLATGVVLVKQRLAEEAEKRRKEEEEHAAQRRAMARRERALKRREYLLRKADEYARLQKLTAFTESLGREASVYGTEPVDLIAGELKMLVEALSGGFEREAMNEEIERLRLYAADDPV